MHLRTLPQTADQLKVIRRVGVLWRWAMVVRGGSVELGDLAGTGMLF